MPARNHLRTIARVQAAELATRLGTEVRQLRLNINVSQAELATSVGVSRQWLAALELGRLRVVDLRRVSLVVAHLGHRLSAKAYPSGHPLRDAGHARLIDRLNARIAATWRRRLESIMPIAGDLRAWDELLIGPVTIGVEAETRPRDLQALLRSVGGKQRDSGVRRVVLLFAATDRNHALVREQIGLLRSFAPLDSRATLRALAVGADPGANGIVLL